MNERIKQLIEQSQKVVGYLDGGYTEIKALDPEKFAELIVKECVKSLWTEECYNSDLALEEFNRKAAKIKQHLGVKE